MRKSGRDVPRLRKTWNEQSCECSQVTQQNNCNSHFVGAGSDAAVHQAIREKESERIASLDEHVKVLQSEREVQRIESEEWIRELMQRADNLTRETAEAQSRAKQMQEREERLQHEIDELRTALSKCSHALAVAVAECDCVRGICSFVGPWPNSLLGFICYFFSQDPLVLGYFSPRRTMPRAKGLLSPASPPTAQRNGYKVNWPLFFQVVNFAVRLDRRGRYSGCSGRTADQVDET